MSEESEGMEKGGTRVMRMLAVHVV